MIDLARIRGPLATAGLLAAATIVVDLGLTALVGPMARWLPHGDYPPADRSIVSAAGRRISGAIRELRRPGTDHGARLGVLLGQSTLECGIDPVALDAEDGLPIRWLNLFGEGGSVHKIEELAELLLLSGLKPDVAVFVINPYMLAGTDYQMARAREASVTNNRLKTWIWTWENRIVANQLAQIAMFRMRVGLFRAFGLGIADVYEADPRPWETPVVVRAHKAAPELEERVKYNRSIGWLTASRYGPTASNAIALAQMIRQLRAIGSEVIIVEMPLRSTYRVEFPPEARALVASIARDAAPGRPVPIIDLEDQVPDAMFLDLDHVDVDGRALCSRLLAERLHELLAPRRSP